MPADKTRRIKERLDRLRASTLGLQAAAVISVEGLTIAASLPNELPEDRIAAMSAAMLALGARIAAELQRGELEQVIIGGRDGFALLQGLDETCALTLLAEPEAALGLLFLDSRAACSDLRELLS